MPKLSEPAPVRRRGPSPKKTAGTRRDIVTAALDLFLERGFAATRMIDVAERAGVAKGTLYLYFADKEGLFEGVIRDVLAVPIGDMTMLAPLEGERVRDFLGRVAGRFIRDMEVSRRAALVRLTIAEGTRFPALAETHYRLALEPILSFLGGLAARALERGELASDAGVRYPQLLLAPGLVTAVWNGLFGRTRPIDGGLFFEAYLDLIFGPKAGGSA